MKKNYSSLLFLLIPFLFSLKAVAQQKTYSKKEITKEIKLTAFTSVKVGGLAHVYLQQGVQPNATLKVSGMPVEEVKVTVEGDVLSITTPKDYSGESVKIYVTYNNLAALQVSDAAEVFAMEPIKSTTLNVTLQQHSSAQLLVNVNTVTIKMTDGADLTITGNAREQKIISRSPDGSLNNGGLKIVTD